MQMFYFSGTGNSKYIAELFCEKYDASCHSIEEDIDFAALISRTDTIGFCYPVYGSCVPRIMREFVTEHKGLLSEKKLIVFCTQLMFSGDGARALTDLLDADARRRVLYAEHFFMPNNICNFALFRIKNGEQNNAKLRKANKKTDRVCHDLKRGKRVLRGFGVLSHVIGLSQSKFFPAMESNSRNDVSIDSDCIACGICARLCPMHNLELTEQGVSQKGNCTLCYRCVNACPKQAITVLIHKKPNVQYLGIGTIKKQEG
ncbi:MAG: EFR1 family ferrodoxin [Anaerofustis sp.]